MISYRSKQFRKCVSILRCQGEPSAFLASIPTSIFASESVGGEIHKQIEAPRSRASTTLSVGSRLDDWNYMRTRDHVSISATCSAEGQKAS